ncbi:glycosyltransferase family 2 protein [Alteromonas sp. H39]|uniref:glycosyltransferase family 2 protein n=1 Tax=Alteromonas sp. H39 TaxID=3389876 RepID=UPI0039E16DAE
MKKLAMRTVKGVAALLPKSLKLALKKNTRLTEMYSTGIRKSGLFYGVPSKKEQSSRYRSLLKHQRAELAKKIDTASNEPYACNVVFFGGKLTNVDNTMASLKKAGIDVVQYVGVFIESEDSNSSVRVFNTTSSACESFKAEIPVLLINSGDTVDPALGVLCANHTDKALLYFDTDYVDKYGRYSEPRFSPDWNPDLQLTTAYINNGVVIASNLIRSLNLCKCDSIASVVAHIALNAPDISAHHIPHTVIHSNKHSVDNKIHVSSVASWLKQTNEHLAVSSETGLTNNILWPLENKPLVSLIIPTKDGKELVKACIDSIIEKSLYDNYEILLIDNDSTEPESLEYFEFLTSQPKISILKFPGPFNYSAINNFGVKHAKGDIIGLVNNDIEVINPLWLDYMVGHAMRDNVGCVGAKLLYSDGRIQHAGVVLGYGGGAGHAHKYFPRNHQGYMSRLAATQSYSAVTAACLLVKKSLFDKVGGLDEKNLAVAFNDVDFCLRIKELDKHNIYCAEAELYHHESVSRGLDIAPEKAARFNRELTYLQSRWAGVIAHDPAYNPNLTLRSENFAIKEEREYISTSGI